MASSNTIIARKEAVQFEEEFNIELELCMNYATGKTTYKVWEHCRNFHNSTQHWHRAKAIAHYNSFSGGKFDDTRA